MPIIRVRGLEIVAADWAEVDEILARYGATSEEADRPADSVDPRRRHDAILSQADRDLA